MRYKSAHLYPISTSGPNQMKTLSPASTGPDPLSHPEECDRDPQVNHTSAHSGEFPGIHLRNCFIMFRLDFLILCACA